MRQYLHGTSAVLLFSLLQGVSCNEPSDLKVKYKEFTDVACNGYFTTKEVEQNTCFAVSCSDFSQQPSACIDDPNRVFYQSIECVATENHCDSSGNCNWCDSVGKCNYIPYLSFYNSGGCEEANLLDERFEGNSEDDGGTACYTMKENAYTVKRFESTLEEWSFEVGCYFPDEGDGDDDTMIFIIVGCVVGVVAIIGTAFYMYYRHQKVMKSVNKKKVKATDASPPHSPHEQNFQQQPDTELGAISKIADERDWKSIPVD
ncbi:hypothetical protein CYMTET_8393 [Cymbomonas tetramitiformis]|uniref:Uncharacterized protein n=1 Tax=Cymbomonas tetramitiformis TaxID=36881 RepID=A0AAE0GT43_9CHLO|nr:hypothetical protein CYMTET_8393 [Cymbomonas tetramitiformis]